MGRPGQQGRGGKHGQGKGNKRGDSDKKGGTAPPSSAHLNHSEVFRLNIHQHEQQLISDVLQKSSVTADPSTDDDYASLKAKLVRQGFAPTAIAEGLHALTAALKSESRRVEESALVVWMMENSASADLPVGLRKVESVAQVDCTEAELADVRSLIALGLEPDIVVRTYRECNSKLVRTAFELGAAYLCDPADCVRLRPNYAECQRLLPTDEWEEELDVIATILDAQFSRIKLEGDGEILRFTLNAPAEAGSFVLECYVPYCLPYPMVLPLFCYKASLGSSAQKRHASRVLNGLMHSLSGQQMLYDAYLAAEEQRATLFAVAETEETGEGDGRVGQRGDNKPNSGNKDRRQSGRDKPGKYQPHKAGRRPEGMPASVTLPSDSPSVGQPQNPQNPATTTMEGGKGGILASDEHFLDELSVEMDQWGLGVSSLPTAPVLEPAVRNIDPQKALQQLARRFTPTASSAKGTVQATSSSSLAKGKTEAASPEIAAQRARLPIAAEKGPILRAVRNSRVVVISGETGCGKTTQLPQFLLEEAEAAGEACKIVVTQPRRLPCLAVSARVADERNERVGDTVGYQIRLESKKSAQTKCMFMTTGVLLRMLQGGNAGAVEDASFLSGVTHLVLDEVHERDSNTDYLLLLLRKLLEVTQPFRLILMSASVDATKFSNYFGGKDVTPHFHIPGLSYPVEEVFLETIIDKTSYKISADSPYAIFHPKSSSEGGSKGKGRSFRAKGGRNGLKNMLVHMSEEGFDADQDDPDILRMRKRYPEVKDSTLRTLLMLDEQALNYELLENTVMYIDSFCEPGAILVFLPGMAEITTLFNQLTANPKVAGNRSGYRLCPVHSMLPAKEQAAIFRNYGSRVRKIILATNIAETSITIDDVVFVVDGGKSKEMRFNPSTSVSHLETEWISKASAQQRKGRAGRVRAGKVFRLYTSHRWHHKFVPHAVPEILRTALDDLILSIKISNLGDPLSFLSHALDPPSAEAIANTMLRLQRLKALGPAPEHVLLPLGYHLAALPLEPHLGKMLVLAAMLQCLDPILTVCSVLSHRTPFLSPFNERSKAEVAKARFNLHQSDLLAAVRAYTLWSRKNSRQEKGEFCRAHYLSEETLSTVQSLRTQLQSLLVGIGFIKRGVSMERYNTNQQNIPLLKAVITAGLSPRVAKVLSGPEQKLKTRQDGIVAIHPSSVMCKEQRFGSHWVVYHEKLHTSRLYLKELTVISPIPLMFFGGEQSIKETKGQHVLVVDGWMEFHADSRVVSLIGSLCQALDQLLGEKIRNPKLDFSEIGDGVVQAVVRVLSTE
jgi:HrpA-like RNA helicase